MRIHNNPYLPELFAVRPTNAREGARILKWFRKNTPYKDQVDKWYGDVTSYYYGLYRDEAGNEGFTGSTKEWFISISSKTVLLEYKQFCVLRNLLRRRLVLRLKYYAAFVMDADLMVSDYLHQKWGSFAYHVAIAMLLFYFVRICEKNFERMKYDNGAIKI